MEDEGIGDDAAIKEIISEVDTDNVSCILFSKIFGRIQLMFSTLLLTTTPIIANKI